MVTEVLMYQIVAFPRDFVAQLMGALEPPCDGLCAYVSTEGCKPRSYPCVGNATFKAHIFYQLTEVSCFSPAQGQPATSTWSSISGPIHSAQSSRFHSADHIVSFGPRSSEVILNLHPQLNCALNVCVHQVSSSCTKRVV